MKRLLVLGLLAISVGFAGCYETKVNLTGPEKARLNMALKEMDSFTIVKSATIACRQNGYVSPKKISVDITPIEVGRIYMQVSVVCK